MAYSIEIARYLIYLFAVIGYVVSAFILGQIAGAALGRPWKWTLLFLFLPIISHVTFMLILTRLKQKAADMRAIRDHHLSRSARPPDTITQEEMQVTPFSGPSVISESDRTLRHPVLKHLQDGKIEQMIQCGEWPMAHSMAVTKLEAARSAGDRQATEMYRAYLELIDPQLIHTYGTTWEEVDHRMWGDEDESRKLSE